MSAERAVAIGGSEGAIGVVGELCEAMRIALRIIEERANLTSRMADEASRLGRRLSARDWETRASDARHQVDVLRKALARS